MQIYNRALSDVICNEEYKDLKRKKNRAQKEIYFRIKDLKNEKLKELATALELNKNNSKCFKIMKLFMKDDHSKFRLVDNKGHIQYSADILLESVKEFYKKFFNQTDLYSVDIWEGEPRRLEKEITAEEVKIACLKLNNGKAAGKDELVGEMFKYGGFELHSYLAEVYNELFATHTNVYHILEGLLIPLNKPGKTPTVNNTRPITLLNMTRKIVSNILLDRIYHQLDEFISPGQSGFRRGRSTSDVVWTYRWLMGITQKYGINLKITGIYLSKAFDCIDRTELVNNMKLIINEGNFRILKY